MACEIAAALMNCGRAPTIVAIFFSTIERSVGRFLELPGMTKEFPCAPVKSVRLPVLRVVEVSRGLHEQEHNALDREFSDRITLAASISWPRRIMLRIPESTPADASIKSFAFRVESSPDFRSRGLRRRGVGRQPWRCQPILNMHSHCRIAK